MSSQIAVRIPEETLDGLDRLVEEGVFANRADAVRAGIESLLREAERRRIDAAVVAGYRRVPDPEPEAWVEAAARAMVADEPW